MKICPESRALTVVARVDDLYIVLTLYLKEF